MTDTTVPQGGWQNPWTRGDPMKEETFQQADPFIREALSENKRSGLLMAVRARWIALAITAVLLPLLYPTWETIYYELSLIGFALIGWAQLRVGRVAQSRRELLLIFLDLALMTFIMVVPSPFRTEVWPAAFQYHLGEFSYFYILLAAGTLGYSWRTILAFGTWTSGLWLAALAFIYFFGTDVPGLSEKSAAAFAGHERISEVMDPNNPDVVARIQEVVIFLIVAGILGVNGRRNSDLLFLQANVVRERANLARHFPPNIVDQMAGQDQPLEMVRSQDVAVMFVDIVGFTKMAERQTPEETVALLRQFHSRLEAAVFDHNGTLDKFLGDGLMATFGTPESGPNDAGNALRCADRMLADIAAWNRDRQTAGAEQVRVSIGLHYGPVVLGNIGSARRLEYAVLGDAVNVASRLEAITRVLDAGLVVSNALLDTARTNADGAVDAILSELKDRGPQQLRGREEPITVWTL